MEAFQFLSDEDEDVLEFLEYRRRPYVLRPHVNYLEVYDDYDFFVRFRLRKQTVVYILTLIEHQIETPTDRNHSISPINQLLLTLRFYATGNFLITVADFMNVSKSSACNIMKKVTNAIASLSPNFIKMPSTQQEITASQMEFYDKARLPRVIGSLDCTHIGIQSPGGNHAEVFRNRKGRFSLNVQTISDINLRILDIVARWPGSVHDQIIYDNSALRLRLERDREFGNSLVVADSGYTNTAHIITPLIEANTEAEQLYNESIRRTRNPVERQYGVWKRRFPLLAFGLRLKLERSMAVIIATAVLNNIAIDHKEEVPPDDPEVMPNFDQNYLDDDAELEPLNAENIDNARNYLVNNYFERLVRNERF